MRSGLALCLLLAVRAQSQDYTLPEPPPGQRVDYAADTVEFDAEHSDLHLFGNVVLKESTWTVKGADFHVDTARRSGRSDGPLLVEDGVSAVAGESGEFDFLRHTGRLFQSSAGHADWRIHARQAELGDGRHLEYRGANFTSCSAIPPHYHFRASSISVIPKKRMLAWNALFYLGDVPVFYSPFLYKSLSPDHWVRWKTQPGFDRRDGVFAKNTLTTQHSESVYSKLFADYYQKQGIGYGGELERHAGADSRGGIYGYRIRETSTGDDRWTILGQGYQALLSSTSFQGRLQLQSDADFNNHYVRSSTYRVTPDLTNGGAFVRRFSQATARISYSRLDVADASRTKYHKTNESIPRLDVQSSALRFWNLPWLNTLSGFADNSFDASRSFLQKSVGAGWEGTNSYHVARGVNFSPKVAYNETYYNRVDDFSPFDQVIGRWSASGNLRFDTPFGSVDATHAYQRRLKSGAFSDDAGALDKGVEANQTTLSDVFLPARRVWARVSSGYDFRTFRDHTVGFRDRLQPIVAEASWEAGDRLSFTFRDDYQLQQGNRALIADARWGDEEGVALGGGVSHNLADPSRYYANLNFAIAPSSPTWRVAVYLRAVAQSSGGPGRLHGLWVFDREISWTRRWHDFYTKLAGRIRPGGVGEASIRVDFKFGTFNPQQAPRRDWEAEWFPERASSSQDDMRP